LYSVKCKNRGNRQSEHHYLFTFSSSFICFHEAQSDATSSVQTAVDLFLSDPAYELSSLKNHAVVKQVFLQKNVCRASSATKERLFSIGDHILTTRKNRLTYEHFELLLMMRVNKSLCNYDICDSGDYV